MGRGYCSRWSAASGRTRAPCGACHHNRRYPRTALPLRPGLNTSAPHGACPIPPPFGMKVQYPATPRSMAMQVSDSLTQAMAWHLAPPPYPRASEPVRAKMSANAPAAQNAEPLGREITPTRMAVGPPPCAPGWALIDNAEYSRTISELFRPAARVFVH
jgi:hypothetical protein